MATKTTYIAGFSFSLDSSAVENRGLRAMCLELCCLASLFCCSLTAVTWNKIFNFSLPWLPYVVSEGSESTYHISLL